MIASLECVKLAAGTDLHYLFLGRKVAIVSASDLTFDCSLEKMLWHFQRCTIMKIKSKRHPTI